VATPQLETETLEEWLVREGGVPSFKYDEDTGERYLVYTMPLLPLKSDDEASAQA
jgi:hypothetical protein